MLFGCCFKLSNLDALSFSKTSTVQELDGHHRPKSPESVTNRPDAAILAVTAEGRGASGKMVANKQTKAQPRSLVTLSGLLNVIDGACAPEGHLLIMTTNHVEHLDPALIRPGRVDMKIHFTFATREQAEMLFCYMYEPKRGATHTKFDVKKVPALAKEFAKQIPQGVLFVCRPAGVCHTAQVEP